MPKRLFIHATNVHQGGGRSLLTTLANALNGKFEVILITDKRMLLPKFDLSNVQTLSVKPTIWHRLKAERWISKNSTSADVVLCFGNLPPLFKVFGHVVVFIQNRYLIDDVSLVEFPVKIRVRLFIERLWLSRKIRNASQFVVQTQSMKKMLEFKTRGKVPVRVLPFVTDPLGFRRGGMQVNLKAAFSYDFVYVASGEPHKNHLRLIEAWCLLAEEGIFPSLCLTLDINRFADLCIQIESMKQRYGLKVDNHGELTHQDVLALYKKSRAALYPSLFESFGLPLIEARQAGIPVLASELDYVRDVLDPEQVFDPQSAVSIARAVKRFLEIEERALPLLDASEFLKQIMASAA